VLLQIITIARNTFIESIRQPIFFVMVLVAGVLQLFTTWSTGFAMGYTESGEVSGDNKLLFQVGLASVFVCGTLLAAFVATAVISREIENKTVLTVVSKPVARPSVVVGKYLGVALSMLLALLPMVIFLLMSLRHGVMSTAGDELDQPVLTFTFGALLLSMFVAGVCNFFYGWYFSQTCMVILAPLLTLAYVLVLLLNKGWAWQPIGKEFMPQITLACAGVVLAVLVLTAVATAVSTRLGQVMTIVVCAGVFVFGLLTNSLLGRSVFHNQPIAVIASATPGDVLNPGWDRPGDSYTITFQTPQSRPIRPGDRFYYSPSPNGFPMSVARSGPFRGNPQVDTDILGYDVEPSLVVVTSDLKVVRVRKTGQDPLRWSAPPMPNDFVFLEPTSINIPALAAWSVVPNMQFFWLVDAVSQNQPVPWTHFLLMISYAGGQIGMFLCLGVVLFQKRDVG
jgi:ABC-2 type transport system permease protein